MPFIPSNKLNLDADLISFRYKKGVGVESLAKQFNCSITPIIRILKENNIGRRPVGFQFGNKHWNWQGGRYLCGDGYVKRSNNGKKIFEHHYIWIQENQMPIPKGFIIHHINSDKTDNRIENLVLLPKGCHNSLHDKLRTIENPENRYWGINKQVIKNS